MTSAVVAVPLRSLSMLDLLTECRVPVMRRAADNAVILMLFMVFDILDSTKYTQNTPLIGIPLNQFILSQTYVKHI